MARGIADRLKKGRLDARLTQGQLAEQSGVEQALISKWETGKVKPTRALLGKVAPLLGIEVVAPVKKPVEKKPEEGARYVQALAYYRAQKKLTIAALADASKVSESVISGIEQGKLPCVEPWVTPLARALGIKAEMIYNNIPGPCDFIGDAQGLDAKYPAPDHLVNYWGGVTTLKEVACGKCGWCGGRHEGLGCDLND